MSDGADAEKRGMRALALLAALSSAAGEQEISYPALKQRLRAEVARDPIDAVFGFTAGAAWLFYEAERDVNPKVTSYFDALMYISTSLNVGYHDIFPRTQAGKLIAAVVQALGPALAGSTLDKPGAASSDGTAAMIERLDAVLDELRALRIAQAGPLSPT